MVTPLSISTDQRDDGTFVLTAIGEIDLSNIDAFANALRDGASTAAGDSTAITVDLTGVEYLDSGAINALFAHADRIHLVANPILMPVLIICGLTEVATVEPASGRC